MCPAIRKELPRLPLDGKLDFTYRCNNNCLHCWLWLPPNSSLSKEELSFDEIRRIVDQARMMGCQAWGISGGEPMLRTDFSEIFDYITRKSVSYKLNTNGTLITPEIANLMRRKGNKMIALYGATAEVHDRVTRTPGSFEAAMRGFAYLKEAGVDFVIQLVPMRENFHQYSAMLELAQSLSPRYRLGAPWLWLSACHSEALNRAIAQQRLDPATVIAIDEPYPYSEFLDPSMAEETQPADVCCGAPCDDRILAACIAARRDFHIDPYGQMSFCYYIKDPALRYDLRQGSFEQAWEQFIPSMADVVRGGQEYQDNCGSCELRPDCRWCGVYGYLEHGRYSAKVDYLCQIAAETRRFRDTWKESHVRYYQIAGITIRVVADFPIAEDTFAERFEIFRVQATEVEAGEDTVSLGLFSPIPPISERRLGKEVHRNPPWAIYRQRTSWVYLGIAPDDEDQEPHFLGIFSDDYRRGTIYRQAEFYKQKHLQALTTFNTDQIWLAQILADRQACYMHAAGFILNGKGLLFVGHSGAGKSTMLKMLRGQGEILCDDRIILRRWPEGFRIHGTWSHGELPDVSPASAPLRAIFFIEQSKHNELIPLVDKVERMGNVLSHVVRPIRTNDWWSKTLSLAGKIAAEVPAYRLQFDKSGQVVDLLRGL